ncbi:26S proteasome non-ATPase regulatory subunit 13 [Hypsibius exemplaris]|uniref:26S proteasome non-ATPase regulatory subunit 13 n=1 Tax=Hypsibius exemplaris TaxID=2072580 RepID=A0A1W0WZ21_HYPEX|nr:26S proteasome non-ATPase regulatory subunit 13 [Hypsibius exemplaris]
MATADYLSTKQAANAENAQKDKWMDLNEHYGKKLWYQISQKLTDLLRDDAFIASAGGYLEFYKKFVQDMEPKMGPYKLAETAVFLSSKIYPNSPDEAVAFLEAAKKKLKNTAQDVPADCILSTQIGSALLHKKDFPAVKTLLEETEKKLRGIDDVTLAHPQFYELSSEYYRLEGTHAEYFHEALKYLGCANLEKLSSEEKRVKAERLAIAAILGEGVYSFGELLVHPIAQALQNPKYDWLLKSLEAFNYGDQKAFERLKGQWASQIPESVKLQKEMSEKLRLMAIVEMGFKRPPHDRDLSFDEIAQITQVAGDQVELLLMRGLSLKLIRGDIDEVARVFHMTWVKPRILNMDQISNLTNNMREWCNDVVSMERMIQAKGSEMLAAV